MKIQPKPWLTPTHFVLLFLLMICFSGAIAQPTAGNGIASFLDQVDEVDFSANVLRKTFGNSFVDDIGTPGAVEDGNILGAMFSIFNSALLAVAMFYFGYQAVSSIAATAEDGQFLGQRFSTVWVPIRFTVGVVSLIPIFGGFSGSQIIFMWFTKIGIGMANAMVMAALAALSSSPDFFASKASPTPQKATEIAEALFKGQVCVHGGTKDDSDAIAMLPSDVRAQIGSSRITSQSLMGGPGGSTFHTSSPYRIVFTTPNSRDQKVYTCGGVVIALPEEDQIQNPSLSDVFTADDAADVLSYRDYSKQAFQISMEELNLLNTEMGTLAKTYVDSFSSTSYVTDIEPKINEAAKKYAENVRTRILGLLPSSANSDRAIKKANDQIDKYGWMLLGSIYQTIAVAQGTYSRAVAIQSSVIPFGEGGIAFNEFTSEAFGAIATADSQSDESVFTYLFSTLGQDIVFYTARFAMTDTLTGTFNPIIELKDLGDIIITSAATIITLYIASRVLARGTAEAAEVVDQTIWGKLFGKIVPVAPAAKAVANTTLEALGAAAPIIMMLLIALFFFGFMLAVYIPMLPFITWFGGLIGWFSSVIESLVAAPIGAFIHLDAEGQGMGQRTQHTYLFLMNVLLRPALMVFGFFAASLGIMILGKLLFILFIPAMAQAQMNSWTGLIMILGYIFVFMSLALTMIHGAFNLIHIIPDQVISWAGGHISTRMGQDTDDRAVAVFNKGSSRGDQAAVASIGKTTPKAMPGVGNNANPDLSGTANRLPGKT